MAAADSRMSDPFTLDHFHAWIDESELTLDSGGEWRLDPFQNAIVEDIFSGYRETWVIIPEGNAKTTLMAGITLYLGDHTPDPWIPIGAASREQAEIMFGQAAGFIERSQLLKTRFRVFEGYRKIKCLRTGGRGIKVYAADTKTGDGVIPTHAFVDELHRHDDLRLYRLWKGKLHKRGGQIITISTAGEPGSEFEEQRETIRNSADERVRDGCHLRAEGSGLVYHEWMVPDISFARDLDIVKQANPLSTITVDDLRDKLESLTLDFGEDWLRLTCNIPARTATAAISDATWDALQTDETIPAGAPVMLGADFAWVWDCTAIIPLWMKTPHDRIFGDPEILEPPRDGSLLNPADVHDAFDRLLDRFTVEMVVMDKSKAEDVAGWLENERGLTVVDRTQSNTLAALDYKRWMEAIGEGWIRHSGHPEFRRHVLNAVVRKLEGDNYRFDRPSESRNAKRQRRRVIDALTAATMVHTTATADVADPFVAAW